MRKSKATPKKNRTYRAPALEKGLEIIELLVKHGRPMSMTEIATEMGRSKNEIFRMLSVLQQKNYLERLNDGDQFSVTNRLFELGMQAPPVPTLLEIALPLMRQLASATQQACHIAVLSGHQIVVIARVESPTAVGFSVRVGHRREITESGSGKLFLAWMEDEERDALLQAFKKESRSNNRLPKVETSSVRKQGFIAVPSTVATGVTDLCAPILPKNHGRMVASLAIPYCESPSGEISMDKVIHALMTTAREISGRLGTQCEF